MRLALAGLLLAACVQGGPARSPTPTTAPSASGVGTTASPTLAWRRIADIPTARSEVAAGILRSVVYVVGGLGGGDVVETLVGDRWVTAPRYPLSVDHAMAAGIDTAGTPGLYVLGGNVNGISTARSFRFLGADGWREIASMPAPRSQGAAVAIGPKIYVVGGVNVDRLVSPTYVYDTAADRWSTVAAIPTPRDHLAAAALAGRVCAVGGRRLSLLQNLSSFECYDPAQDRWSAMPDAPTARGGIGAAAFGGRLIVLGGEQPAGTIAAVESFDSATGRWSRLPDLASPRHGLGVVAFGNTILALAGGPVPGATQTSFCEALDLR